MDGRAAPVVHPRALGVGGGIRAPWSFAGVTLQRAGERDVFAGYRAACSRRAPRGGVGSGGAAVPVGAGRGGNPLAGADRWFPPLIESDPVLVSPDVEVGALETQTLSATSVG